MPSDEDLMAAYVAGDAHAFQELFRRYSPLLLRVLKREMSSSEQVRDLVQQTFLHLHRSRLDFELGRKLRPWIFTIALNLKREYFRRGKRRRETSLDQEGAPEPAVAPRGQERADAVRELAPALAALPEDQRQVIELHWFAGLSFPEVAQTVGASVSAVKVRAHRGYVALRRELGANESTLPGNQDARPGVRELKEP
ncbi:MAG TPA: sigma-70 family RNA polymerase sigma factor [Polyangiaceae bacterium]|jgi:RNA polymerase sigma-70 factor (ECF subfamily)